MTLLELLKSQDPQTFYLIITFMTVSVMTLLTAIYTAVRVDKLWSNYRRQKDIEQIKREIKSELKLGE